VIVVESEVEEESEEVKEEEMAANLIGKGARVVPVPQGVLGVE